MPEQSRTDALPAGVVEITPEMIEAGHEILACSGYGSDWCDDDPRDVIREVYLAMRALESCLGRTAPLD